jgi:hypothetical protein
MQQKLNSEPDYTNILHTMPIKRKKKLLDGGFDTFFQKNGVPLFPLPLDFFKRPCERNQTPTYKYS